MNFDKIDIYGFKSFADKVEVKFESGITAIVGPNGCGKSNVAESILFVMGEKSAKSMRGSTMVDVIFNGTEKRKPQSYCEVSLYFNNSTKIFSLDYDEVILTRKLYKNGESEYFINKKLCRRKDIVNALREIGLGKESYCIIGQGKIDSILSAKPEDRRNVFEEASGISKFKEEKNSTLNKLENVNDNLTRINDILSELERQIGPLKNQAENAKIFLELSEKLKNLEINIYVYQYDNSNTQKKKIYDVISAIDKELEEKRQKFEEAVGEYERSQSKISELDELINNLRDELMNLTVALEKQNGEIKLYKEKISILNEQNEKLTYQIEQGKYAADNNIKKSENLQKERENAEKTLQNDEFKQKTLESNYNLTLEKLSIGEANAESFDSEFYSSLERSGDIKSTLLKFQTELDSLIERKQDLLKQKGDLELNSKSNTEKVAQAEAEIKKIEEKIKSKNQEKQSVISEINKLNEEYNDIDQKIDESKVKYHSSLSKYNLLKEMKEYNEGFAIGVKRLLEQSQSGTSIGGKVVGVVASLMKVPSNLEVAIEMALGASVQNIVTKNEDDAKSLIEYLKVNKFGRVTFLPITGVKERYIAQNAMAKLSMKGVLGVASDLIEYDEKYDSVFKCLLGSTIIIDNLDNAVDFARATNYSTKLVTLAGDIISPQGSMTGGSRKENNVNLLGRDREIESLSKELVSLKTQVESMTASQNQIRSKSNGLSEKLNKLIDEIHYNEMERTKYEEIIESLENQNDELEDNVADNDLGLGALDNKIEFVKGEIERIKLEQVSADTQKSQASESKKQANDLYGKLRAQRDEIFEELSKIKISIENDRNNLANLDSEIERLSVASAENEFKVKEAMLELQKNNQEIENYKKTINDFVEKTSMSSSSKQVEEVRAKIAEVTAEKKTVQEKMNLADGNKMMLAGEIQKASDRKAKEENLIVKIDTDLENLQNRVWEEYQMTYADAKQMSDENFDFENGTNECSEVKKKIQKLGNVNISAIDDIKSVSERYDDLKSQRDDLVKAQEDLDKIIANLTERMEKQFLDCFNQIRANFQVIFKELFEGGRADIVLEDENNILECGIDVIAEPPGKTLKNITLLSGGERALTAVAILFAILKLRPMPFCVLDEIEAALDDANVSRYAKYLHRYSGDTQFIVITHRKPTMELADVLYGVTMEEKGVSKVVSVKLSDAIKLDTGAM